MTHVADVGPRSGDAHLGTRIHRRRLRHLFLRRHSAWQQGTNEHSNGLMRQHSEAHRTCARVAAKTSTGGRGTRTPTRQTTTCRKHRVRDHGCAPPTTRWERHHGLHIRPDRVGACVQEGEFGGLTRRCRTSRSSSRPLRQARWFWRFAAPSSDPCALAKYET
jgi:hypothetical protein